MNKYQNGKIYIITGSETDKVYLGSTIQTLGLRFTQHKFDKNCNSTEILKSKDYNIVLLESYPCKSEDELLWRERYWFNELKNILVNQLRPIITPEEKKEYRRIWREENRKHIKEFDKKTYHFCNSWGGDYRYNNNLLKINKDVFK